ncbi:MAG TPA: hypothetical protein VK498_05540 [Ferruginibacter sp.]|nr:hypothetical protein [Ferruginibacter sp.]
MKKNIINLLLLTTILFVGCKKNDTRYPFDVDLQRVPYVNVAVDATGSQAIDLLNLASFNGKYTVSLLYPNDIVPSKVDIIAIKNDDRTTAKLVQANVTTFPSTFTITAAQLQSLFGAAIKLGDNYDLGADIYVGDKKYEAFPLGTGVQSYGGTGQANQPGFIPTARFSAICAYDPNIYQGNFVVVSDGFTYGVAAGTVIPLTKVSNTSFSFEYPNPYALPPITPVVVTVNTGNNNLSIVKQKVSADFGGNANYYMTATGTANTFVTPCDKELKLNISHTVDAGSFGSGVLFLRKQ